MWQRYVASCETASLQTELSRHIILLVLYGLIWNTFSFAQVITGLFSSLFLHLVVVLFTSLHVYLSVIMREHVGLKLVFSATKDSKVQKFGYKTFKYQRTTRALIRLQGCAGWFVSLLFAYGINRFCHGGAYLSHVTRKPVFGVCAQVRLKMVCSATEIS